MIPLVVLPCRGMARENTKYMSVNATKDQHARFVKLAENCDMTPNALMRLIMEKLKPSDVKQLLGRR